MFELFNRPIQKDLRKGLRHQDTSAEHYLWLFLKNKQLGYKFRRQHGIDSFIVDFYCPEKRLVVEIDGAPHFTVEGRIRDKERSKIIESYQIRVIRFTNNEVMNQTDVVISAIQDALDTADPYQPPLGRG